MMWWSCWLAAHENTSNTISTVAVNWLTLIEHTTNISVISFFEKHIWMWDYLFSYSTIKWPHKLRDPYCTWHIPISSFSVILLTRWYSQWLGFTFVLHTLSRKGSFELQSYIGYHVSLHWSQGWRVSCPVVLTLDSWESLFMDTLASCPLYFSNVMFTTWPYPSLGPWPCWYMIQCILCVAVDAALCYTHIFIILK